MARSPHCRRSCHKITASSANSTKYCTTRTPVMDITQSSGRSQIR